LREERANSDLSPQAGRGEGLRLPESDAKSIALAQAEEEIAVGKGVILPHVASL